MGPTSDMLRGVSMETHSVSRRMRSAWIKDQGSMPLSSETFMLLALVTYACKIRIQASPTLTLPATAKVYHNCARIDSVMYSISKL
jgi:hypothetical protein